MNKHILLVMKWLNNHETVTQEELDANKQSARAAAAAGAAADAAAWAAWAAWAAARAAYSAAAWAARAAFWVDEYFEITGEDKQIYIDKLGE
jgi:hypothetical protein